MSYVCIITALSLEMMAVGLVLNGYLGGPGRVYKVLGVGVQDWGCAGLLGWGGVRVRVF